MARVPRARLDGALVDAETRLQHLNQELERLDSALPSQRQSLDADIDKHLAELDSYLNRLASDIRLADPSNKPYYEEELQQLRGRYGEITSALKQKRLAAGTSVASRQSEQAMLNQRRSQAVTENLDEAIRLGNDSITTGNVAMAVLADDRRRFDHIAENLDMIDDEAQDGLARAKRMLVRAFCNSFLAWIIVVILLGLLGVEIWWKATKNK
jgi:hypothetical protein